VLGDHLALHPDRWHRLRADHSAAPRGRGRRALLAAVGAETRRAARGAPGGATATVTGSAAVSALRTAYRDELLVLAAADLGAVSEPDLPVLGVEEVAARLSDIAGRGAARRAGRRGRRGRRRPGDRPGRLAVIAMGKCGGRELNYVSDVDVVFVAEPADAATARARGPGDAHLGESCFEVDANLRPEGRQGALVRTLDGHVAYYKRWAKTWEFQALLKARPIAGDPELGKAYAEAVAPMVWSAAGRPDFVVDVQAMRRRVEENVRPDHRAREIKLGPGGLRDVEFAGATAPARARAHRRGAALGGRRSTRCGRCRTAAYVGRDDGAKPRGVLPLPAACWSTGCSCSGCRRTHLLPAPDDTDALRWLARSAKLRPDGRTTSSACSWGSGAATPAACGAAREAVLPAAAHRGVTAAGGLRAAVEKAAARPARGAGLDVAEGALGHLRALTGGFSAPRRSSRPCCRCCWTSSRAAPTPTAASWPTGGCPRRSPDTPWYLRLLRDEGLVAQRLMQLLGTSALVPDLLVRAPEVLRLLAAPTAGARRRAAARPGGLRRFAAAHGSRARPTPAARPRRPASLRRHELLRVACADLLGMLSPRQVCAALSSAWVAVLAATLESVQRSLENGGRGRPARLAVIGMGRLGGAELGYGSDADVLFVCEPVEGADERDAVRYASQVGRDRAAPASARRARTRRWSSTPTCAPRGRNGPLVRTMESYRAYYARWSQAWEAQALLRASPVAGDPGLGGALRRDGRSGALPRRGPRPGDRHRDPTHQGARRRGTPAPRGLTAPCTRSSASAGLADVEWTIQLLQLQHAGDLPELRTTSTLDGPAGGRARRGCSLPEEVSELTAAWTLATRARNAVMLVRGKPGDQLPRSGRELAAVAYALGYPPTATPACSSTTTAARRAAPASSSSACSTGGRP
jgi:glutamate-ammonia-ligase adenylyltransferase